MMCEHCHQKEATTHVKRVVNGAAEEFHLCAACAQQAGLLPAGLFEGGGEFPFGSLFSGFLGSALHAPAPAARCGFCGSSMHEIAQSGRVGCAKCYTAFAEQLEPTLQRIHGALEHNGKSPESDPAILVKKQREKTLLALREQIGRAVKEENYEQAAALRDEIRKLEEGSADA